MPLMEHEVEIRTGRRDGDGRIRAATFAGDMVALTLEGHGERAPTLLLTLEQARSLHSALTDLISRAEAASCEQGECTAWDGEERRRLAS